MNRKIIIWIGIPAVLLTTYFIADSILFDGVKPRIIHTNGFHANYYTESTTEKTAAFVLIGGGQWGDYWGQQFAKRGFVGFSLPYIGKEDLPTLPEEIDLAYFEKAIHWLREQPEVLPEKVMVMGASRNAELALVIASIFPEIISGAVAYAPSSVSWSNTVLPYNSDELKASWRYQGKDIPYLPMDKIEGNNSDKIETLEYWISGLRKTKEVSRAIIPVEKINGPIILFSGMDDQVWPSSMMADMIEQRLQENKFKFAFENIKYENVGHLISGNPESPSSHRTGSMNINGKNYEFEFGGTEEGDMKAKQDAKERLFDFLDKLK